MIGHTYQLAMLVVTNVSEHLRFKARGAAGQPATGTWQFSLNVGHFDQLTLSKIAATYRKQRFR